MGKHYSPSEGCRTGSRKTMTPGRNESYWRRAVAAMGGLANGPPIDGLIEVEDLTLVLLYDEQIRPGPCRCWNTRARAPAWLVAAGERKNARRSVRRRCRKSITTYKRKSTWTARKPGGFSDTRILDLPFRTAAQDHLRVPAAGRSGLGLLEAEGGMPVPSGDLRTCKTWLCRQVPNLPHSQAEKETGCRHPQAGTRSKLGKAGVPACGSREPMGRVCRSTATEENTDHLSYWAKTASRARIATSSLRCWFEL